jgi:hypothetical protein
LRFFGTCIPPLSAFEETTEIAPSIRVCKLSEISAGFLVCASPLFECGPKPRHPAQLGGDRHTEKPGEPYDQPDPDQFPGGNGRGMKTVHETSSGIYVVPFRRRDFEVTVQVDDLDPMRADEFVAAIYRAKPSRLDNTIEIEVTHRPDRHVHTTVR